MEQTGENNKRRFSRVNFNTDVQLVSARGNWHCQLLDISLKGMLTEKPHSWVGNKGDELLAEVHFEESDILIRMEVVVSHIEGGHIGFRCKHIDLDSITHLRRLIELNLGDAELVNRELFELTTSGE